MRFVTLLVAVACTASCASSGSSTPDPGIVTPTQRIVVADNHGALRTTVAPNARVHIPVAPSRVFDVLKPVYEELGVPSSLNDPSTGRLGNPNFFRTRKLGTEPISSYLNCGTTITGSAADTYKVNMAVVSQVRPDGHGETDLETAVTGQARNMEGTTSDLVACGTTGRLEDLIKKRLFERLGVDQ